MSREFFTCSKMYKIIFVVMETRTTLRYCSVCQLRFSMVLQYYKEKIHVIDTFAGHSIFDRFRDE